MCNQTSKKRKTDVNATIFCQHLKYITEGLTVTLLFASNYRYK